MTDEHEGDDLSAPRTSVAGGAQPIAAVSKLSEDFNFDAVSRGLGEVADELPDGVEDNLHPQFASALREVVAWLALGDNPTSGRFTVSAASKRLIAMARVLNCGHLATDSITALAHENFPSESIESVNKHLRALNRRFGIYAAGQHPNASRAHDRQR